MLQTNVRNEKKIAIWAFFAASVNVLATNFAIKLTMLYYYNSHNVY